MNSRESRPPKKYPPERYMFFRNAIEPSLTHDDRHVTFICDVSGVPQVWMLDLKENRLEQVTFHLERVGEIKPHPRKDDFIYTLDAGGNERFQLYLAENLGEHVSPLTNDHQAIFRPGSFSREGRWFSLATNSRDIRNFDLKVIHVEDGEEALHVTRSGTWMAREFSPNNDHFLALEFKSNLDQRLALVDLKDGTVHRLKWQDDQEEVIIRNPIFLNQNTLLLITNHGRDLKGLARVTIEDDFTLSDPEYLLSPPHEVENFRMSKDQHHLIVEINEHGYSRLKALEYPSMKTLPSPQLPKGVLKGFDITKDGNFAVIGWSRAEYPPNIWKWMLNSGECQQLTDFGTARIPKEALARPQLLKIHSFDGLPMEAFLFLPPHHDPPHPCIISIHGGPESQARPEMRPIHQYFVNLGYAVLVPNVRGSTGYGRRFTHLDDKRLRMDSVRDIKAFVDHLKKNHQRLIKSNEFILYGGSYGGFMVLACLYSFPEIFKAGIEIVGIVSFRTFLERTGKWRRHLREVEYGSLEEDGEFLDQISPLTNVEKITAPLLVIHGKNDPRVPFHEAEQLVKALKERGRHVELLAFDDEGHGVVKIQNKVKMLNEINKFLASMQNDGEK